MFFFSKKKEQDETLEKIDQIFKENEEDLLKNS